MLREFVCSAGRLISRPPLLLFTFSAPFFRFKPFYQARVQAFDVKNADTRIKIQKMIANRGGQPVENYIIRNHRQQE
jgi:hypothetical protein